MAKQKQFMILQEQKSTKPQFFRAVKPLQRVNNSSIPAGTKPENEEATLRERDGISNFSAADKKGKWLSFQQQDGWFFCISSYCLFLVSSKSKGKSLFLDLVQFSTKR